MSKFSGKCDLYDHICILGDSPDEMENFLKFKKRNHGVIYQLMKFHLTKDNIEHEASLDPNLKIIVNQKKIKDNRYNLGYRIEDDVSYQYMGKIYTDIDELDKHYFRMSRKAIKIETILDIIPYYPYIISIQSSSKDEEFTVISNKSYVDEEQERCINNGYDMCMTDYYRQALSEHYKDVVLKYYAK